GRPRCSPPPDPTAPPPPVDRYVQAWRNDSKTRPPAAWNGCSPRASHHNDAKRLSLPCRTPDWRPRANHHPIRLALAPPLLGALQSRQPATLDAEAAITCAIRAPHDFINVWEPDHGIRPARRCAQRSCRRRLPPTRVRRG